MKNKETIAKPSRSLRTEFHHGSYSAEHPDMDEDIDEYAAPERHAWRKASSPYPARKAKAARFLRVRHGGLPLAPEDPDDEDVDDEWIEAERPLRVSRTREPDDWEGTEQEAQDWIDAEREAQHMLGIDDLDDLTG